jgi:agmatine deiminase
MTRASRPPLNCSPSALGFSLPAEWQPHHATWFGWPHHRTDWPGKLNAVQWAYAEMIRKIAPGERARILVNSPAMARQAQGFLRRTGVDLSRVDLWRWPTNRGWMRDAGPVFVQRSLPVRETAIVDFHFNAWAKYRDWQKDRLVPQRAAQRLKQRRFRAEAGGRPFVLEGGAVDVNGQGTVLTTEECLLDQRTQTRNPNLDRSQTETALERYLGVTRVIWLGRGIAGDDTHGHVDDICRFVNPATIVLVQERRPRDPNYGPLAENRERLQSARLADGSRPNVVELPMPAPLFFNGQRLPASYANFYIANAAVLVPTFNDPNDRIALGILGELFVDRPVVGIHAVDLALGLGTVHCLTQQEPASLRRRLA